MTMPPPARDDWRLIPDAVIAQDERQTQAQEWGAQARAEIAQQWGDMARAEVTSGVDPASPANGDRTLPPPPGSESLQYLGNQRQPIVDVANPKFDTGNYFALRGYDPSHPAEVIQRPQGMNDVPPWMRGNGDAFRTVDLPLTQAPTSSDSLTNPLGTGNAGPTTDVPPPPSSPPSPVVAPTPPAPALPAPSAPPTLDFGSSAPTSATRHPLNDIPQFGQPGLTYDEALAACGPAAAVRLASLYGNNIPLKAAVDAAKQVGWDTAGGMNGIANEKKLLDALGVPASLDLNPDPSKIIADARSGNPVTLSTTNHYFTLDDYNPQTGQYHVGKSGTAYRGGSEWMTMDQMRRIGGGINGALFVDSPVSGTAGTAALESGQTQQYATGQASNPLVGLADQAADAFHLDRGLFRGLVQNESTWDTTAKSTAGAQGLTQLMPDTAKGLGVTDITDPTQNLMAGARYLRQMIDQFGGDVEKALQAYNAGPGRVMRGDVPQESKDYAKRVMADMGNAGSQPALSAGLPGDFSTQTGPDFGSAVQAARDAVGGAVQTAVRPFADVVNEARAALGSPVDTTLPASMQPTPSDTLTNPLGTGNNASGAPQRDTPAIGSLAPPPTQPNAVLPALGEAKDAALQGDSSGVGAGLNKAREAVATSAVGPVLDQLRGPMLLTDQEVIQRTHPEVVQMMRQWYPDADEHTLAEMLRTQMLSQAVAMTHTGEGITPPRAGLSSEAQFAVQSAGGDARRALQQIENSMAAGRQLGNRDPQLAQELRDYIGRTGGTTSVAAPAAPAANPEVARLRLQDFPEWLHQDLTDAATGGGFHVDQRRGVIPLQQQAQMGADLAENSNLDALIRQGKAGKAYNTEQIRAMKTLLVSQAQKVNEASQAVAQATARGEATDIGMARALAEGEKLQALQSVYEGARAEWGRAGQAWQAPANVMELSPTDATARIFNKVGGRDNALKAITEYNRLVQSGATPFEMANFWAKVEKPPAGFQDWFTAIRYNSMLSGPRTFEVNAIGNLAELPWRFARDTGASLVRGRPEEIAPEVAGIWTGLADANRKFMEVMSQGITAEKAVAGEIPQGLAPRVSNPVGKAAASALDLPGKLLGAADEWAKAIAYNMALGRRAGLQASREGLRGDAWGQRVGELITDAKAGSTPSARAMMKEATSIADRMTYKGDMGAFGTALGGISKVPYLGNIILPFIRTVYHITARGIDRSPIGALGTAVDVATGKYGTTLGAVRQSLGAAEGPAKGVAPLGERLGDNLIGSAIALGFYQQAMQGNISGAGPDDTEKKGMLRAEGWQPYSIKLGDRWVSYANWGPVAIPLAGAAAAAEAQSYRKPGADAGAIFADAARRTAQVVTEQTYLQSIGAVWKGLNEPDKYGAQFVGQFVTSMVPFGSALNTAAQAGDPYQRQPDKKDLGQFIAQSTEARLPGLRQNVPVQQDQLGRPTPNDASGAAAISPLRSSMIRNNTVLQEMLRNGADVPEPATDYRNIPLKPDEQRQFNELAGRYIEQNVRDLMKDRTYQGYDASDKQKSLQRVVEAARKQAGGEVISKLSDAEINQRLTDARAKKAPVPILP